MGNDLKGVLRFIDPERNNLPPLNLSPEEREILEEVNQRVAGAESLDAVMNFVYERTRGICPCDRLGLAFAEEGGARVFAHWARAEYEPLLLGQGYAEDLRGSTLQGILETGRTRVINDLTRYLKQHPGSPSTRLLVREGVRSSMTCPLKVEGRIVGVMFRSSRQAWAYRDRHVQIHLALAERLSQAVEKAWRIEQLRNANKAYFEMLGFVSHELKSPVASLVTDAHVLLGGFLGPMDPRQAAKIRGMISKGDYLLGLIRGFLDLARIEGGDLKLNVRQGVDFLAEVVEPSIELVLPQIENRGMSLTRLFPDQPVGVECDPGLLRIVVTNLLSNAVKYGQERGQVRIHVNRVPYRLDVAVWNEGQGFTATERSQLFRKFSRLPRPGEGAHKGTGLGLYNSWRIVHFHGGTIGANSEPGAWAEFSFSIPQPLKPPSHS